jgi:hypothetical protein
MALESYASEAALGSLITNPSIIIYVNGMVYSFCAQGIKKSFKSHKSIKDVSVSLKNKTVELKLKHFAEFLIKQSSQ